MAGVITGDTVNWQYCAYGSTYPGSGSFVVPCSACGNFAEYFEIETTANTITFDYSGYTGGGQYLVCLGSLTCARHLQRS
jgi:hypothetical protein